MYDGLLECLQIRYTDAMTEGHDDRDCDSDAEWRVDATIPATELRPG